MLNLKCGLVYGSALAIILATPSIAAQNSVAIDVGHSSVHPGATSAYGKTEFSFNAALADIISETLAAKAVTVMLIGHDGKMTDLPKRTELANAAKTAFFLSIHHDSVQSQYLTAWQWHGKNLKHSDYASGFSLFVSRKNPQLAASLQCATSLGKALKQQGLHPSQHHAEAIEGESKTWADQENGVFYYDNLVVLKTAAMPAVLLEAAVIANRHDEEKVQTPQERRRIATAVAQGLLACGAINPMSPL